MSRKGFKHLMVKILFEYRKLMFVLHKASSNAPDFCLKDSETRDTQTSPVRAEQNQQGDATLVMCHIS